MSEEIEGLHEEIQDVCKEVEEGLRREDSQLARFGSLALLFSCSELLPDVECRNNAMPDVAPHALWSEITAN